MAINTKGTKIPARLASDDEFPYIEDTDQLGGYQVVATIADRDNIMLSKRKASMQVKVQATNLIYELGTDLTTWSEGKKLTKNDYSDTDKTLLSTFNASNVIDKHFFDNSFCVSDFRKEIYAHQAYCVTVGQYLYTVYMCNEGGYDANGNFVGTAEGEKYQIIRMSKTHLIDNRDITFFTVATETSSWPNNNLTLKFRPQSQNILVIDANTIRVFFIALTNFGFSTLCYRDFNVTTATFGDANRCRMFFKGSNVWQYADLPLIYDHFAWVLAGRPAADVSYPSNPINYTVQDIYIGDFFRAFNNAIFCIMTVGSGIDKNIGSIFMKTVDNGANWQLFCCFNPMLLPGTNGVDKKSLWEGTINETPTDYVVLHRGSPQTTPANPAAGTWRCVIPKNDLFTTSLPTKISDLNNEKMHMFKANNKYYLILREDDRYQGPNYTVRTLHGIYLCNADFSTLTRVLGVANSNGAHTFGSTIFGDLVPLVYSTSDLRLAQIRNGVPSWQNTSNIRCLLMSFANLF